MAKNNTSITFYGGAGTVTGANFLFEVYGKKILVDCGLEQGSRYCDVCNYEPFPYDPKSIDILCTTHAHADHIGRIPKLVKDGFSGTIISTPATKELSAVMFEDALGILAEEAREKNQKPLYGKGDVAKTLSLWQSLPYRTEENFGGDVSLTLHDAGHILGSSICVFNVSGKKVVFTGDLGNSPSPLLRDTESITDATYMVMESVYGDRNHEARDMRQDELINAITDTVERGGVLLIPSFSIERTQVLLYELNRFVEKEYIPSVPVFLDSPLAISVTDIYRRYTNDFNEQVQNEIESGDDIFQFPKLTFTPTIKDSKSILDAPNPKIVIAGSGMSAGGRVLHHEKHYLADPKNMLLLVGYQAVGTLGRRIQEGAKRVRIFDDEVSVRAEVRTVMGYSAHKDSEHLVKFVEPMKESLKKVFVAMGEPKASLFLVQRLRDYLGVNAITPEKGRRYEIDL